MLEEKAIRNKNAEKGMSMREIDFRIASLNENIEKFDGKRIALYGIKNNAKRILEKFADQNIVVLIDESRIGETIFGKPVVSLESVLNREIEVIIIAAEMKSCVIVSERISAFCKEHKIMLLNMYGTEEFVLQDAHKQKLCMEDRLSVELVSSRMKNKQFVFVQLTDVLCEFAYKKKKEFFEELGRRNGLEAFYEGRTFAEKKVGKQVYSIADIYDYYEPAVYPNKAKGTVLCEMEEELWIGSFLPNVELIKLVNNAVLNGNKVYIISDLKLSSKSISKLLDVLGINNNVKVLQESLSEKSFSNGALRPEEENVLKGDALYIGTDKGYISRLAFAYGMELLLVRNEQKAEFSEKTAVIFHEESFTKYQNPKVTVAVYSNGDKGDTKLCLEHIKKNTIYTEYEIVLLEKNFENLTDIRGKYVVFLQNSCLVQYNWLAPMVYLMEEDAEVGMVGSKILHPNGSLLEAGGILWPDGSKESYGKGQPPECSEYNYVKEVDYISGVSVMLPVSLWKDIRESGIRLEDMLGRETELAAEIRKHGKKVVFQPASEVTYLGNQDAFTEETKVHSRVQRFAARDRKKNQKTIVFFSYGVPTPDCDAGSVTIFSYLFLFVRKGYIVKFVPMSFQRMPRYSILLEQMGIEVLYGDYYRKNIDSWLSDNREEIEFAFINYPGCGERFMKTLKEAGIKTCYYGHDLHYLRKQREYELNREKSDLEASEKYYSLEKELINAADFVYYPSYVEEEIVKKEFGKENVKAIPAYVYHESESEVKYCPENRKGIMFIGGYKHLPNVDAVLWFAKDIYPGISSNGQIPFFIVGSNEPPEVQALDAPGIIHKGYVTDEELEELYRQVKLVIAPLRYGAGVKGKIINTLYQGVPLVSTSVGVEGILEADRYIAVADNAEDFGKKVMELYYDEDTLLQMSQGYGEIIRKYFSDEAAWDIIRHDF